MAVATNKAIFAIFLKQYKVMSGKYQIIRD